MKTAADYLIESENVVFAREDPDKPFSYTTVRVLRGKPGTSAINHFVDSSTRRRLKVNEDHVVVFVRASADKSWRSLGIADAEYQRIVQRILVFSTKWGGNKGALKRSEYFLKLFGHENRTISELAYLELGRAPYSMIKRVARSITPDNLRPMLTKREYIEWRSLAILMLAQNAGEPERESIQTSFRGCQRFSSTTNLAAWATAYIELNGLSAVEEIEVTYLRDANRTEAEVRAVITALSVHGRDGHVHLRDRIARIYGVGLEFHPYVAGMIASDLTAWKKWEYREHIAKLLVASDTRFEMSEATAIKSYLRQSMKDLKRNQ